MATQENITLINPLYTESAGFQVRRAKKEQKLLAELASALKVVEEAAQGGGKIVNLDATHEEEGPSNSRFEQAMESMVLALQMMQVKIGEFQHDKSQYMYEVSQAERDAAKIQLKKMEKEIEKLAKKEKEDKIAGIFEKVAEALVGTIMTILAVVLAQPELMIMAIMSFAAASGAMNYATKGIAEGLEKLGLSDEAAEIIAAVAVTLLVIGVTCGMAPGVDTEAVTGGAEDIASAAEDADSATSTVETQENTFQNLQNALKSDASPLKKARAVFRYINVMNRASMRTNLLVMNTMQALSQTHLVSDLAVVGIKNKRKKEEVQRDVEIAMAIVAIIVSLASMDTAVDGAKANAETGKMGQSRFGKVLAQIRKLKTVNDLSESSTFINLLEGTRLAGVAGEGLASLTIGVITILQAELEGNLATINSNQELLHTSIRMENTEMKDDQVHDEQMEKSFRLGDRSLTELNKGYAGFANLFASHSPV